LSILGKEAQLPKERRLKSKKRQWGALNTLPTFRHFMIKTQALFYFSVMFLNLVLNLFQHGSSISPQTESKDPETSIWYLS